MLIKVKTLTGKEIEIDIEPTDKVERIKERVEEKEGIPPQQQRLIFSDEKQFTEKTEEFHKIPLKEVTDYFQSTLKVLHFLNTIEDSKDFQYIAIQLYILSLLNKELEKGEDEILSVQESKKIKSYIQYVMVVGVYSKLSPTLPFYQNKKIFDNNFSNGAFSVYNILKFSIFLLGHLLKCQNLRLLILPDSLKGILVGIYQVGFCQLKKPSTQKTSTEFVITDEIYSKLLEEKQIFRNLLDNLRCTIHPAIFVRETMVIFQSDSPLWFKKSVSQTLTHILRMNNGVENIVGALLDGVNDDSAKTWQILEVISKLLVSCRKFPDFRENTCRQLLKLLDKIDEHSLVYERIFISFTKTLYAVDRELSKSCLIGKVINEFLYFTYKSHTFNDGDKTENIVQNIRLLHALFIDQSNADIPALPLTLLKSTINVIYRLYSVTVKTAFNKTTKQELTTLLISFLTHHPDEVFKLFDSFLFNINASDILEFRNDVLLTVDHNSIHLHCPAGHTVTYSTSENADTLLLLFKNQPDLRTTFFSYLLKCLTEKEKYFKKNTNHDLVLNVEDEFMNEYIERNLAVYKLLSELAEDKTVQKMLVDKPDNIINYIQDVLLKTVETNLHKTEEIESDGFQTVFTVIMILQSLVTNCDKNCLVKYKILIEPIQKICMECTNKELQELMKEILNVLDDNGEQTRRFVVENVKSDLDKAIDDICDPLLPVQGHGLMTLTKLIEKKDKQVLDRKQYVLNIFQQNIKNEDSYIYLTAISGLAALADLFPDTVLNTLCEEYVDFSRKNNDDGHEIRMKIGEVLVRTTKTLGDLAPKYKPLLLNTFLNVTKDDDDLMRTSSLSNLGEVCKILGYRLGTIVTEVLVCVHAIIATDKSVEARRAAVTVIRQLFVGLDSEMIAFLKDDILPIYRTLKQIYGNDKDDIMRLQAQLALEELNENMKKFVFPNPQLHMEKKIVMLD